MRTHRFGLNYVPSKRWYYCWNDWNAREIAEDFDAIASLGVDHLRVMLIWSYFQPNPTWVSPAHLGRLKELVALARERNLDVFLCPLTGWLSGYRFLPTVQDRAIASEDIFLKEDVFAQSTHYLEAVLEAVEANPNFLGFDLGNEINVLGMTLSTAQGDAWGRKITDWLRPRMNGKWIVNGVDHQPWFLDRTFSPGHLVESYDAVTIHAWSEFTGCLLRGRLSDAPAAHLSAFLTYLCRHHLAQAGVEKPVWVQEFGCSKRWGGDEEMVSYLKQSVSLAVRAGATWFTWWCSHDIDPCYQFHPLEYDLGLLTTNNRLKPLADAYRELIAEHSGKPISAAHSPQEMIPGLDANFSPHALPTSPNTPWLEQMLATRTWQLFDHYLQRLQHLS